MTQYIEELANEYPHVQLIGPGEEAMLSDSDRENIAYARAAFGLAQRYAAKGNYRHAREQTDEAVSYAIVVPNSPECRIDRIACLDRAIAQVEMVGEIASKTIPWFEKKDVPQFTNRLLTLRGKIAQRIAAETLEYAHP